MTDDDEEREYHKKIVIFLLIGAALSAASFLLYLLPEPGDRSMPLIIALSAADIVYTFINAYVLIDEESDGRALKAAVITVGYLAIFNAVPALYLLFTENTEMLASIWQDVLFYSMFCGPMLIVVILLVSLLLIFNSWRNGHTIR